MLVPGPRREDSRSAQDNLRHEEYRMKHFAGDNAYAVSAFRDGTGWTRPCNHQHPNADDADKCAEKRNAPIIVFDPIEATAKCAIAPAPYLRARRERQRCVELAEQI